MSDQLCFSCMKEMQIRVVCSQQACNINSTGPVLWCSKP